MVLKIYLLLGERSPELNSWQQTSDFESCRRDYYVPGHKFASLQRLARNLYGVPCLGLKGRTAFASNQLTLHSYRLPDWKPNNWADKYDTHRKSQWNFNQFTRMPLVKPKFPKESWRNSIGLSTRISLETSWYFTIIAIELCSFFFLFKDIKVDFSETLTFSGALCVDRNSVVSMELTNIAI